MDIYQTKCCTKCNIIKPITDFHKQNNGFMTQCKCCVKIKNKEYREKNKDNIKEYKKEYRIKNKDKIDVYNKQYNTQNKEKIKNNNITYRNNNKEQLAIYNKEYREQNKEKLKNQYKATKSKRRENHRNRIKNDPLYALAHRVRARIRGALKSKGYSKKSKTYEMLGCSFEELYNHIESRFVEGMSWDNRSEWHIDHIIPLSSATTEEELIKLNHYTNLQPLWAIDNLKKGNKFDFNP